MNLLANFISLQTSKTGVEGTIEISTEIVDLVPSVKCYCNDGSMMVTISSAPQLIENYSYPNFSEVVKWVALNHVALTKFWYDGSTWFSTEITAFQKSLKKI